VNLLPWILHVNWWWHKPAISVQQLQILTVVLLLTNPFFFFLFAKIYLHIFFRLRSHKSETFSLAFPAARYERHHLRAYHWETVMNASFRESIGWLKVQTFDSEFRKPLAWAYCRQYIGTYDLILYRLTTPRETWKKSCKDK